MAGKTPYGAMGTANVVQKPTHQQPPASQAAERHRAEIDALATPEAVIAYLTALEARWGIGSPHVTPEGEIVDAVTPYDRLDFGGLAAHVVEALGLGCGAAGLTEADLYNVTAAQRAQGVLLYQHVKKMQDMLRQEPLLANRVCNLLALICFAEKLVHCAHRVKRIGVDGSNQVLVNPRDFKPFPAMPMPIPPELDGGDKEKTPYQALLLILLDKAQELCYSKYSGEVYRQILTAEGRKTFAWERVCNIKQFVYTMCDKETNRDAWKALTSGSNTIGAVTEYLTNCQDLQFPELRKDRTVFAFRNGLYFAKLDAFWAYSTSVPPPAGVIAAAKYFNLEFDTHQGCEDWYDIPTPNLQKILDTQGFPKEVCRWLYAFLGRLLYDLGTVDGWQVIPFCKGQASSGKSTILLKVAKHFYDKADVGVLSNNIEKKFGISAFYDKYLFVAPEIKGDLQLEQAEFQSIVSGEDVQVALKHATAQSVEWKVPGILAGNEVPSWTDNAGSITRRIVIFDFVKSVENGEMDLGEKLGMDMAAILLKCNRAYWAMVRKVGKDSVWQHLPQYFHDRRQELAATTNVLRAFVGSDLMIRGQDKHMPFEKFRSAFGDYCILNNQAKPKYSAEFWAAGLRQCNLTKTDAPENRMYRGEAKTTYWIIGIDSSKEEEGDGVGY